MTKAIFLRDSKLELVTDGIYSESSFSGSNLCAILSAYNQKQALRQIRRSVGKNIATPAIAPISIFEIV
jgi:hypothetical protein